MKRTIAMNHPLLMGVDGFLYPEALQYQDHVLDEELGLIMITRRQTARGLKLRNADAWQRTAVQSETGLVTLRQLLLHAIHHVRHHLRFIIEKHVMMK